MTTPVGSLAAEAALLLDAVASRLEALRSPRVSDGPDRPDEHDERDEPHEPDEHGPVGDVDDMAPLMVVAASEESEAVTGVCPQCGHDPAATVTCTGCPLCRLLALLRGERPETTARLVDGALTVVQALRALLPEPGPTPGAGRASSASPAAPARPASPPDGPRAGADVTPSTVPDGGQGEKGRPQSRPAGVERIVIR